MTWEEAAKILEYPVRKWSMEWDEREDGLSYTEAIDLALTALRGPTREMVEKVWRGEWEFVRRMAAAQEFRCSVCGANNTYYGHPEKFCADCGSAMTDEAVDMMLERWKEAVDDETCGR